MARKQPKKQSRKRKPLPKVTVDVAKIKQLVRDMYALEQKRKGTADGDKQKAIVLKQKALFNQLHAMGTYYSRQRQMWIERKGIWK